MVVTAGVVPTVGPEGPEPGTDCGVDPIGTGVKPESIWMKTKVRGVRPRWCRPQVDMQRGLMGQKH